MAKRSQQQNTPAPSRNNKVDITILRKAKKVIQSNGIPYFRKWAAEQYTGGARRKAGRPSLKINNPKLMNQLIEKYEGLGRKMDLPRERNSDD